VSPTPSRRGDAISACSDGAGPVPSSRSCARERATRFSWASKTEMTQSAGTRWRCTIFRIASGASTPVSTSRTLPSRTIG
jgi:hypothetical protein